MRLTQSEELALVRSVLKAHGTPGPPAALQAEWLAEADMRGHPSHGLQRLPVIVRRIRRGLARPSAQPQIDWRAPATALIDGQRALGPWAGMFAVNAVAERAKSTAIAMAGIHNANHLGLLAPYVERLTDHGLIGIVLTTTEALVHPWNGIAAMVGTNPIAVGVPTGGPPVVLDMATSAVSMGKVLSHRHRGRALEPGWAVDQRGEPTIDPDAARALAPFGGAKGYGLGLALGLVIAITTESAFGPNVTGTLDATTVCNKGDLVICIDPTAMGSGNRAALSAYLEALRAAPTARRGDGVSVPGDRARARRSRALEAGVEVPEAVLSEIRSLVGAEALGP